MFHFRHCVAAVCIFATLAIIRADDDVATYEEVKDLPNHPEKYLFDVRSREMVANEGSIPTAINIPLAEIGEAMSLNNNDFKQKYGRDKPPMDAVVIFTCHSGSYAQKAADMAKAGGWKNAKPYLGSWVDWAMHEGL